MSDTLPMTVRRQKKSKKVKKIPLKVAISKVLSIYYKRSIFVFMIRKSKKIKSKLVNS